MSLLFLLFYYVNGKPNGDGALIDGCISCILGITALNGRCWDQGPTLRRKHETGNGSSWSNR